MTAGEACQDDLTTIRSIVLRGLRGRRARAWLFGSRAAGRARRTSDVDVAVEPLDPADPLPPETLSAIREGLAESCVPFGVDLVDLTRAAPEFAERVRAEGIPWTD